MDFSFIKRWVGQYPKVAGLEITFLGEERFLFHLIVLKKEKNSVKVLTSQLNLNTLEQLPDYLEPNIPLVLLLDGKGVIHKKLDNLSENPAAILQAVLPNASLSDFIFSTYQEKTFNWLSIVRRPVVDDLLLQIQSLGYSPIQLLLGPFALRHILTFLPKDTRLLSIGNYNLIIDHGGILHLEKSALIADNTINLAGENINMQLLPAFAAAFQGLIGIKEVIYPELPTDVIEENFHYKKLFRIIGWVGLIGLLVLLLVNFTAFSWLSKKNQQLDVELAYHHTNLERLAEVKEQYQEAQQFFEQNSVLKSSKVSYYANEIGRSLPKGIRLIELNIFPAKGSYRREREKSQRFDQQTIKIKGESQRSTLLNEWIKKLEQLDWIKEVKVLPYSESSSGLGNFELQLLITD